jgi:ABC-type glycerol-3-phosphate transport system substrate-binding protein
MDQPAALEALQWIADLGVRRVVMPTPAYPEVDQAAVNGDAGFTADRVAMAAHGRWRVPEIRRLAKFGWDVAPMPKGKIGRLGHGWYSGKSIISGTKFQAEAVSLSWRRRHSGTTSGRAGAGASGRASPMG